MTWARLDDHLHDDPRTDAAGFEALGLFLVGLSWMADKRTATINRERLFKLAGRKGPWLASRLVTAGLWEELPDRSFRLLDAERYLLRVDPQPTPQPQGKPTPQHPSKPPRVISEVHERDDGPKTQPPGKPGGVTPQVNRPPFPSPFPSPGEDPRAHAPDPDPDQICNRSLKGDPCSGSQKTKEDLELPLFGGPIPPADGTPIPASSVKPKKGAKKAPASEATDVERGVFEGFLRGRRSRRVQGSPPVLDAKRIKLIRDRIHDGHAPETLAAAAEGVWISQWHFEQGQSRFDLALRDGEHVERFERIKHERDADLARFAPRHDDEPDEGEPEYMPPPEDDDGPPLPPEHAAAVLERFGLHEGARVIREQAGKQAVNG